jgi:hypothetical protein
MSLEKRPLLFILALYFLCAFCDNDDASTTRETIDVSAGSGRDFWSTETLANSPIRDPESTGNPTSLPTSDDPEFTGNLASDDPESKNLTSTATYETTAEFQTTDYSSWLETRVTDDSTVTQTTRFITTTLVPEDATSADNTTTICDPLTWPINASGN